MFSRTKKEQLRRPSRRAFPSLERDDQPGVLEPFVGELGRGVGVGRDLRGDVFVGQRIKPGEELGRDLGLGLGEHVIRNDDGIVRLHRRWPFGN